VTRQNLSASFFSLLVLVTAFFAGRDFLRMHQPDLVTPGPGVVRVAQLSDYHPRLKNTGLDTKIYFLEGEIPGATLLVLGGTHPNEPAGMMAAVLLVENVTVPVGRLIVLPHANASAFTCTDPGEGVPDHFVIPTAGGDRFFRFGSRFTNWVEQWPDPLVYLHHPSQQKLSGPETRNLNRAYPGQPDGSPTERLAYAIVQLVKQEAVDITIDLHESAPEYPVVDAIVSPEKSGELVAFAIMYLQAEGLEYSVEPSPYNFHGLSHRELSDYTETRPILFETANTVQGRLRGRTVPEMIVSGKDRAYLQASQIADKNVIKVDYPESGIPLKHRVGRHLAGIAAICLAQSDLSPDKPLQIDNIPAYSDLQTFGLGHFLTAPEKR